jgi:D-sedoheptulose 7-phosphate isomerase
MQRSPRSPGRAPSASGSIGSKIGVVADVTPYMFGQSTMEFFLDYFDEISRRVKEADLKALDRLVSTFRQTQDRGRKVILVGNGGSASMASHVSVDLTKVARVRSVTFNEPNLLTCFANDYGHEHWVEKALEFHADPGDTAVLISSGGRSPNIVNGAIVARERGLYVVTFSGFDEDNPLRQLGELNFWVRSRVYNVVEMTHHIWLLAAIDKLVRENGEGA